MTNQACIIHTPTQPFHDFDLIFMLSHKASSPLNHLLIGVKSRVNQISSCGIFANQKIISILNKVEGPVWVHLYSYPLL